MQQFLKLSLEFILLIIMFSLFFVEGFIHFSSTKRRSYVWITSLCCVDITFLSLSSGRLTMGSFWRWTGIQWMTSYCQVQKTVNIRWAVFEYTSRPDVLWVFDFFYFFKSRPASTGMGQLWSSALYLVVSRLPDHLFVLGSGWRGVCCGLLQHSAALWQDWSKKKPFYSPSTPCFWIDPLESEVVLSRQCDFSN